MKIVHIGKRGKTLERAFSRFQKVGVIGMITCLVVGASFIQANAKTREAIVQSIIPTVYKDGTIRQVVTLAKRIKNDDISSSAEIEYKKLDL